MDAALAETATKVYLKEIRTRLDEAARIAKGGGRLRASWQSRQGNQRCARHRAALL